MCACYTSWQASTGQQASYCTPSLLSHPAQSFQFSIAGACAQSLQFRIAGACAASTGEESDACHLGHHAPPRWVCLYMQPESLLSVPCCFACCWLCCLLPFHYVLPLCTVATTPSLSCCGKAPTCCLSSQRVATHHRLWMHPCPWDCSQVLNAPAAHPC